MKLFAKLPFFLFCYLCAFSILINAQSDNSKTASVSSKTEECTNDLIKETEKLYQMKKFLGSERKYKLRHNLKKVLDVCPKSRQMTYVQKELENLNEEIAQDSFIVGNLYYKRAIENKKGGLKGAQARFRGILERFPNFSKMDEVLFLLAKTYLIENKFEEAQKYLQKLIDEFPKSKLIEKARSESNSISIKECRFKGTIYVTQRFKKKFRFTSYSNVSVLEAIEKAGGISLKGGVEFIAIYRLEDDEVDYFFDRIIIKYKLKDLKKKNMQRILLKPCDIVDIEAKY